MRRRRYLKGLPPLAVAGSLGGCVGTVPLPVVDSGGRTVEIESVHDEAVPASLEFEVRVEESRIGRRHTAVLEVGVKNVGDVTRTLGTGVRPPFSTLGSESGEWLLLEAYHGYDRRGRGCWEPESNYGSTDVMELIELAPGERLAVPLELWGSPHEDSCMPTGTQTFTHIYGLPEEPFGSNRTDFEWGFSVSIVDAESQ